MRILDALKSLVLEPTSLKVTTLISLVYAVIFISSIVVHETVPTPPVKPHQRGLDLDQAWADLKEITFFPHPYNSHSNVRVRGYLLRRLRDIAHACHGVEVDDDLISNGTFTGGFTVVYFEGENLLVKIDGQDTSLDAVLFSAHFDSVSTAPGTTDNGMGAVTLIQLVEYYAANKPKRTVIFNLNNGEEDWSGARVFFDHPWSQLPTTFLHVEGAGNGGRPVLIRTSSADVTDAFRSVSHPRGSSLWSHAFKKRLIRFGTDFSVYENAGMKGLELSFLHQRSRYHTEFDSVAWLDSKASLWLMMENAMEIGNALLSREDENTKVVEPVYFDVFGRWVVVVSQGKMLVLNVILLVIGPSVVGVMFAISPSGYMATLRKFSSDKQAWIHGLVLLILCPATTFEVAAIFATINTYIVHSSAYAVAITLVSTALISLAVLSRILSEYIPTTNQALQTTINHGFLALVWWVVLCWASYQLRVNFVGWFYYATFAYIGQVIALLLSLGAMTFLDEPAQGRDGILAVNEDPSNSEEPTERTSLLPSPAEHNSVLSDKARCTWLLEILVSLGIPCILATEILLMLMDEIGQLLADGYPPMRGTNTELYAVYFVISLMAVLIALPIVPFASQIHSSVTYVLALALIGTGIYNLVAFPFSATNPLKVFFQQSIGLTTGENRVQLVTIDSFKSWYTHLPSARHVECAADNTRLGLINCAWSGRTPNVTLDDQPMAEWVTFSARKIGERKATFVIRGRNTRSCRIYSDTPIISLDVRGGHSFGLSRLNSTRQVYEVRLWSRTWDREFIVDLTWADGREHDKYTGRVACEWAEWDRGQIPALDEVKTFSPPWVALTRLADGLVEGMHTFEL